MFVGIHIEGPFISENKCGAHRTDFLRESPHGIEDLLSCYGSFDNISIVTLAPEIPNMIEKVIPELINKYKLIVSIGHSVASLDDGERAICSGARFITHLFNAMPPFHHRYPSLLGKKFSNIVCQLDFDYKQGLLTSHCLPATSVIHYSLIVDGIHVHSAAVRLAHRVHPHGLVLVTDAAPALGLPDGTYHMAGYQIAVENKRATIAGTETLSGGLVSLAECVQNMRQALLDGEIEKYNEENLNENDKNKFIVESIEAATLHPASGKILIERNQVYIQNSIE